MPRTLRRTRFTVRLPIRNYGNAEFYVGPFLDMLRYDGAQVEDWTKENGERATFYVVTLSSERFTPDRWSSMGLTAMVVE